jgi:hypothetical protein
MSDFPYDPMPAPPILTPYHMESIGGPLAALGFHLGNATSAAWPSADRALFFPFTLSSWATAYQLLFFVGATSSGNIDMGIYNSQNGRIVSAGSTAMSATVNTIQELNITDTVLAPGDYLLGVVCSSGTGTTFTSTSLGDELGLQTWPVYEQATALPLPDPCVPVLSTLTSPLVVVCGIQFVPTF